ncbi:hypothetical protein ABW19_dt0207316 [Dactylella cylindrospora]|nr:hypothetical protein ABW19_dt0207316 [Dactylella cylindrospora]
MQKLYFTGDGHITTVGNAVRGRAEPESGAFPNGYGHYSSASQVSQNSLNFGWNSATETPSSSVHHHPISSHYSYQTEYTPRPHQYHGTHHEYYPQPSSNDQPNISEESEPLNFSYLQASEKCLHMPNLGSRERWHLQNTFLTIADFYNTVNNHPQAALAYKTALKYAIARHQIIHSTLKHRVEEEIVAICEGLGVARTAMKRYHLAKEAYVCAETYVIGLDKERYLAVQYRLVLADMNLGCMKTAGKRCSNLMWDAGRVLGRGHWVYEKAVELYREIHHPSDPGEGIVYGSSGIGDASSPCGFSPTESTFASREFNWDGESIDNTEPGDMGSSSVQSRDSTLSVLAPRNNGVSTWDYYEGEEVDAKGKSPVMGEEEGVVRNRGTKRGTGQAQSPAFHYSNSSRQSSYHSPTPHPQTRFPAPQPQLQPQLQYRPQAPIPLHDAVLQGQFSEVKHLLKCGYNKNSINYAGENALHIAIRHGLVSIAVLLTKSGVDVNRKDLQGFTPFDIAQQRRMDKLVKLMRKKGGVEA